MVSSCGWKERAFTFLESSSIFFPKKSFSVVFGRVVSEYQDISISLHCTVDKLKKFCEKYRHIFLFAGMSALSALVDPVLFFSSLVAGSVGTLALWYVSGGEGFPDIFIEKAYESFIAQTSFTAINGACHVVQAINNHYIFHVWKDGSISTILSGVLAGATIVAIGKRILC